VRNAILTNTLRYLNLSCVYRQSRRRVTNLHLTRYFNVVELDDSSVGACMSYFNLPDSTLASAEELLSRFLEIDVFAVCDESAASDVLCACIPNDLQRYLVVTSVTATIANALSSPLIRAGGDDVFEVLSHRPAGWFDGIESALIVGFGGYLRTLIMEEHVKRIHVVDLGYDHRRSVIEEKLEIFRKRFSKKTITASSGFDSSIKCRDFDLVSITGSTLCNGTLEGILETARPDALMVLQGQSASLHPCVLFRCGIRWIATTVKPSMVGKIATRGEYSGESLRSILEGTLPWIYLARRERFNDRAFASQ
jgi:hypothetical protein